MSRVQVDNLENFRLTLQRAVWQYDSAYLFPFQLLRTVWHQIGNKRAKRNWSKVDSIHSLAARACLIVSSLFFVINIFHLHTASVLLCSHWSNSCAAHMNGKCNLSNWKRHWAWASRRFLYIDSWTILTMLTEISTGNHLGRLLQQRRFCVYFNFNLIVCYLHNSFLSHSPGCALLLPNKTNNYMSSQLRLHKALETIFLAVFVFSQAIITWKS